MASIYSDIRAALETHLSNISGIPSIAYENVQFNPSTDASFVRCQLLPTTRRPAHRGLNPQQRYDGVFTVFCYAKEGNGPAAADAIANAVIDAFEATTDISYTNSSSETIILSVDYVEREQGILDNPWYYVPVNVNWYIYN